MVLAGGTGTYVRTAVANHARSTCAGPGDRDKADRLGWSVALSAGLPELDETWALLWRLPERQRLALVLASTRTCPEAEIARSLGCRPGTVKSLIHRGLARVRKDVLMTSPDCDYDAEADLVARTPRAVAGDHAPAARHRPRPRADGATAPPGRGGLRGGRGGGGNRGAGRGGARTTSGCSTPGATVADVAVHRFYAGAGTAARRAPAQLTGCRRRGPRGHRRGRGARHGGRGRRRAGRRRRHHRRPGPAHRAVVDRVATVSGRRRRPSAATTSIVATRGSSQAAGSCPAAG